MNEVFFSYCKMCSFNPCENRIKTTTTNLHETAANASENDSTMTTKKLLSGN